MTYDLLNCLIMQREFKGIDNYTDLHESQWLVWNKWNGFT